MLARSLTSRAAVSPPRTFTSNIDVDSESMNTSFNFYGSKEKLHCGCSCTVSLPHNVPVAKYELWSSGMYRITSHHVCDASFQDAQPSSAASGEHWHGSANRENIARKFDINALSLLGSPVATGHKLVRKQHMSLDSILRHFWVSFNVVSLLLTQVLSFRSCRRKVTSIPHCGLK